MKETYTLKQAMDRLGLKTHISLLRLERKYPAAFVVLKQGKTIEYDKTTIDRFADLRDHYKKERR
jgi:hypothetical protein